MATGTLFIYNTHSLQRRIERNWQKRPPYHNKDTYCPKCLYRRQVFPQLWRLSQCIAVCSLVFLQKRYVLFRVFRSVFLSLAWFTSQAKGVQYDRLQMCQCFYLYLVCIVVAQTIQNTLHSSMQ